jgi:hypothetical protein
MKRILSLVVPFVLALAFCGVVRADDFAAKVEKKADGTVVAKVGDKEYTLTGDAAKTVKESGDYTVKGTISADGKSIETTEVTKKAM